MCAALREDFPGLEFELWEAPLAGLSAHVPASEGLLVVTPRPATDQRDGENGVHGAME